MTKEKEEYNNKYNDLENENKKIKNESELNKKGMKRLIEENEKLNKENQSLKKDINKITTIKESNKNKESLGERIIKLTNQISNYEKQLDDAENKIGILEKENKELRNEIK